MNSTTSPLGWHLSLSACSPTPNQPSKERLAALSSAAETRKEVSFTSDGSNPSARSNHARDKQGPITSPAPALRRERRQMLVRVTAPPPISAATERFATGGSEVSGIITAMPYLSAPPPNPSFKRTRLRRAA